MLDLEVAEAIAREALKTQTALKKRLRLAWCVALATTAVSVVLAILLAWRCA